MSADRAHACPQHPPGRAACYTRHACRCDDCGAAAQRQKKRSRCGLSDLIDAGPAKAHAAHLVAAGYTPHAIAAAAGVGPGLVVYLLSTARRTSRRTAAKVLAVTEPDAGLIDATGTRRRVRALMALGWSIADMSGMLGLSRTAVHRWISTPSVTVSTARAARDLYDRLWDQQPPQETRYQRMVVTRLRQQARDSGWLPPLAWDDDTIDRPDAKPYRGRRDGWADLDGVRWLLDSGESTHQIARRMGCKSPEYLAVRLRRHGEHELADIIIGKVA